MEKLAYTDPHLGPSYETLGNVTLSSIYTPKKQVLPSTSFAAYHQQCDCCQYLEGPVSIGKLNELNNGIPSEEYFDFGPSKYSNLWQSSTKEVLYVLRAYQTGIMRF